MSRAEKIAKMATRTANQAKCPYCTNRKVNLSNCLSTTHPKIAKEWHSTLNGKITPNDVFIGSHIKIWWKYIY